MSALNYTFQNDAFQLDAFEADIALEPGIPGLRLGPEDHWARFIRRKDPSPRKLIGKELFDRYRELGGR